MTEKLDLTDKRIISELSKDGRMGLVDLGKRLGLSHTAVRNRLKSMIDRDILKIGPELNLRKLGLQVAVLGIEVDGLDRSMELARKFGKCPWVAFIAPMTGDFNIVMIVVGEDFQSLQNFIEMTVRPQPGIKRFSTSFTSTPFEPSHLPLRIPVDQAETAPCGMRCAECEFYTNELCPGCPSVIGYRGNF